MSVNLSRLHVRWSHWMSQETISASAAVQLMVGLDPIWTKKVIHNPSLLPELNYAQKIFEFARKKKIARLSPADWIKWAHQYRIRIHPVFVLKLHEHHNPPQQQSQSVTEPETAH